MPGKTHDPTTCRFTAIPSKGVVGEFSQINVIIFIETNDSAETASLSLLNNADMLTKIWANCPQKKPDAASKIPQWLMGIKGYTLQCQDLRQAQGLLTDIGNLL